MNADYDKLFDQVRLETDIAKAAEMFIQLNDIVINEVSPIPTRQPRRRQVRHRHDAAGRERRCERLRGQLLEHRQLEPDGVALTPTPLPVRWERGRLAVPRLAPLHVIHVKRGV